MGFWNPGLYSIPGVAARSKEKTMAGRRILWVEDDPDIREAFKLLLASEGWDITTAESAEEGLRLAPEVKPDLIISDVIMGGEHGFNLVGELRADEAFADTPIVIFSSVSRRWGETRATREDAMLTEADEFVDKADGAQALLTVLRKYLS